MADNPSTLLQQVIDVLKQNKATLKDTTSIESFGGLALALKDFSTVNWKGFGTEAETGLKKLGSLSEALGNADTALNSAFKEGSERNIEAFRALSSALNVFSEIKWGGVAKGVLAMNALPTLLKQAGHGFKAAAEAVKGLGKYKSAFESLEAFSSAFVQFGSINWKSILYGIPALRAISTMFPLLGQAIKKLTAAIGSHEASTTVKSFATFVEALEKFGTISWGKVTLGLGILKIFSGTLTAFGSKSRTMKAAAEGFAKVAEIMGKGVASFFKAIPFGAIAKGLLLFAGLAVSIGLLAGAFMLFSKVDWSAVEAGFWAMTMFAGVVGVFAVLSEVLVPGLLVLAGLGAALLLFGASLIVVGKGMQFLAEGISAVGDTVVNLADQFDRMSGMSDGLIKTAGALGILAAAIVAFSAATAGAGLVGAVGGAVSGVVGFLTGAKSTNPIDQIARLADMSDKLNETASALERINAAITGMPSTAGVDLSVSAAQSAELAAQRGVAMVPSNTSVKTAAQAISNNVTSTIVNSNWMPDRSSALILAPAI